MSAEPDDHDRQPTTAKIERLDGPVLLEFGASWCGHCKALAPKLARLLEDHPDVHHVKIEDGPSKPLGRSFGVKHWPTLVFMKDGQVVEQVARPGLVEVREGLELIDGVCCQREGNTARNNNKIIIFLLIKIETFEILARHLRSDTCSNRSQKFEKFSMWTLSF